MRKLNTEDRFWSKVRKTETCWIWTAGAPQGYGVIAVDGQSRLAHRISWQLAKGTIPDGMVLDHVCHNKLCVNPEHLRLATRRQNCQYRKGAQSNNRSSGVRGVTKASWGDKWLAQVNSGGVAYRLGTFETLEEAAEAVRAKRAELHDFPEYAGRHTDSRDAVEPSGA